MKKLIKGNHIVKKLSKYVAAFDHIDKVLIVLGAKSSGVSIISFTSIVVHQVELQVQFYSKSFSYSRNSKKKLLNITRNKKKMHDKILMLAKSRFNSIETLISQVSIDMEISHGEFITILNEKDKYEKMKHNLRSKNEKYKIVTLSSIK